MARLDRPTALSPAEARERLELEIEDVKNGTLPPVIVGIHCEM